MAVGLPMKTTYANGDVYSASDVNDITGTVNLIGQTTNLYAGKNKIINGDFGIWQRGTSFSNPSSGSYQADRWSVVWDGTGATRTISRQTFTPMTAPVAGYEYPYFYRFAQSVAGTGGSYNLFQTRLEDVRTFAGQTVTISFWGKAAATTSIVKLNLEQEFGTGGSPSATVSNDIASTNFSLTTSWQRFTVTTTVPSISGKTIGTTTPGFLGIRVWIPVNATFTLDFFGFQIESGSAVTAFQTSTGTLSGELAACQRYYQLWVNGNSQVIGNGTYINGTQFNAALTLLTEMRTAPSMSIVTGTNYYKIANASVGTDFINSITLDMATSRTLNYYNASEAGATAGQGGVLSTNNAAAFVAFQADL